MVAGNRPYSSSIVQFPAPDAKRAHASLMFRFMDQVSADAELNRKHPQAARVAGVLRRKMRPDGQTPAIDRAYIAAQLGCSVRTVQGTLTALVARGHLERISGKSRGTGSRFRAVIHGGAGSAAHCLEVGNTLPTGRQHAADKNTFTVHISSLREGGQSGKGREASKQAGYILQPNTPQADAWLAHWLASPAPPVFLISQLKDGKPVSVPSERP